MNTLLIVVLLILLLGGGGGYYGYNRYGGRGLGGALGLVLLILIVLWVLGIFGGAHIVQSLISRTGHRIRHAILASRFWRSASGFWRGPSARRAWLLIGLLVGCVLLQLAILYRLNLWSRDFFDARGRRRSTVRG